MALRWHEKRYATGIDVIDTDNRLLFDRIDHFLMAEGAEEREREVGALLHFLTVYADTHFPRVEAYMADAQCPVSELNREDHMRFRGALGEVRHQYERDGATQTLRLALTAMVVHWLENHVAGVESRLRLH